MLSLQSEVFELLVEQANMAAVLVGQVVDLLENGIRVFLDDFVYVDQLHVRSGALLLNCNQNLLDLAFKLMVFHDLLIFVLNNRFFALLLLLHHFGN